MEKVILKGTLEGSKDRLKAKPSELIIAKLIKRVFKNNKSKTKVMG